MRVSNKEIAQLLRSVAAVYTLKEKNRFRIIAYENAADAVEHLNREIYDIWENSKLEGISGIGKTIAGRIDEYFKKGDNSYLVKTIRQIPPPVLELLDVPGIGPKRAAKLVASLKLEKSKNILSDLAGKGKSGQIAKIEGFGEKSQTEILAAINLYKKAGSGENRMVLPYAYRLAGEIKEYMRKSKYVERIDSLGSLRRMVATIGDIDLAAVVSKGKERDVIKHFLDYEGRTKTLASGSKKALITLANGRDVDLRISDKESYGAMLQYNTGSKAHNIKLREYALKKGWSLSEYGIKKMKNEKGKMKNKMSNVNGQLSNVYKFKTEEEFYKFLGLQYIPPEIRDGTDEIDLALKNKIPKLVETHDLKGEFHIHSDYNLEPSHDLGRSSVAELIKKAKELKYEYIAISDHNPATGKLNADQIISIMKKRYEKFKKMAGEFNLIISCEVDILPDGKIALPEKALDFVDLIIISIHSSFRQSKVEMTKRILKALSYPKVKIFGHPTARLIGRREEIEADWRRIFEECKKKNIALEINSWPERFDLPDTLVRKAKDMGLKFAIDTDAHAADQMDGIFYGVSVARRGWLEKSDVINAGSFSQISKWIKS